MRRSYNRAADQIRPLNISWHITDFADGSLIFEIGKTKVLCTVSLVNQVPMFLRGKNKWWLTASYALLPTSTKSRTERESATKRNDRSVEISRLIGRSLRSVIDCSAMTSEKTIHVDCDVIQADGGTRTACITGAFAALKIAQKRWMQQGLLSEPIMQNDVVALSVGILDQKPLLDIDFAEDSAVQADFNFVMTREGALVEIQGSAEQQPISWQLVIEMKELAYKGIQTVFDFLDNEIMYDYKQQLSSRYHTPSL